MISVEYGYILHDTRNRQIIFAQMAVTEEEILLKKAHCIFLSTDKKSTVLHVSFTIMYNCLAMQSLIGEWVCVKTQLNHKGLITIASCAVQ